MESGSLLESIHSRIKSAYRGPIRSFAVESGLHYALHSLYTTIISKTSEDIQSHEVAGVSVRYRTESYAAWERLRSFEGELPVMERFAQEISDGHIVWDVGANMGTYSCLAGNSAENVSVVSFEPVPRNIERLRANVKLNSICSTIRQEALDETNGEMNLSSNHGGDGQYSFTDTEGEISVPTSRGDTLVEDGEVPCPAVVKIDVEGAELRVLRGMRSILDEIECVYIEIHPQGIASYGGSETELEQLLSEAGFNLERIHDRGDEYFLRATKN